MGRDRSAEKVRLKLGHGSRIIVERWSSKYSWVKRCSAFDDNELEKESIMLQKERLNRRLQMERDAWNRRDKLIKKADTIARVPLLRPETSEDGTQIFMPTDKWSVKDAIAFYEYSDKLGIFATGGEKPKMDIIDAINFLATNEVLPPEFAVVASRGIEQFKNLLRELLKNGTGDVNEQFEPTEPIGAFSDILATAEEASTTPPPANDSE